MAKHILKNWLKHAFAFAALITFSYTVNAQTKATDEHVRELLTLTGAGKIGVQVMSNMMESYKKQMPSVPMQFWDEFVKEVNANDLVNLVVPVYAKYFSDEDILQIIQFYKSPVGTKLTEKLPLITQDCYAIVRMGETD